MASVLVINGPNLNQLGLREPDIYGHETLADLEALCIGAGEGLGLTVECFQASGEDWQEEVEQAQLGKLYQRYAYNAVMNTVAMQGGSVEEHVGADGEIQLVIRNAA